MDIEKDLKNSIGDYAHIATKAGLSCIPFVGGAVSEVFNTVIAPPLEKRRNEWLVNLYTNLKDLEEKVDGFHIEDLSDNEIFISTVMQASQIALKNHQQEKLIYLQNAVVNSIIRKDIEDSEKLMLLQMVDELTIIHIKILYYFQNPNLRLEEKNIQKSNTYMGSMSVGLNLFYPELSDKRELVNMIVKYLYNKGLLNIDNISGTMSASGIYSSRTTEFGNRFINYITKKD